ncbi:MAG: ATP-binding protein [Sulfurimonas sp.]|uniref:AAA family ATPase n=1 Tax=Sulfurimonas sp. TaxID=2022749 RepID=UPI0026139769|nr:ATP-binding protein [Sulfurimonas sp.]MDD2653080.1 ATP-binding protein [Sulfurimonas sp.]MDD3452497.1 ATP-binding protein [Sulfurimonas sp.]
MIGRNKELEILSNACEQDESKLIAVYGRRRIGKTYLINHMFSEHKKDCLFFRFTGSYMLDSSTQLENFIEAVYDWFKFEPSKDITNWMSGFNFLKKAIASAQTPNQKVVIFLDEVPWIDKKNSGGFIGALGYFWNEFALSNKNIVLILCGSNSSWIKNKIFEDSNGPLYQRLDIKIHLKPFDLKETKEYLLHEKKFQIDDKTIAEIYMVFGGVAKYLSLLDSSKTMAQNIDELIFNIDGHLNKEYIEVLKSLFDTKASYYSSIIKILSQKQSGFTQTELANALGEKSGSKIKDAVAELSEAGFIMPLSKLGSKINAKYIISDPFVLFYNKWGSEFSKNELISLQKPYFSTVMNSQKYAIWSGFAFEVLCLVNIDLYLQTRMTKGLAKSYGYWNFVGNDEDSGAQIDFIVEYENSVYDIVECKFYNSEFVISKDYKENLLHKVEMFKKYALKGKYDIKLVMLTSYGCQINSHYNALNVTSNISLNGLLA